MTPAIPPGVYALGSNRSLSWRGVVAQEYWAATEIGPEEFVDIDFDRWIFHHPISVDELKRDPDFDDASILRWRQATNFLIDSIQWHAIERRVNKRRPTDYPTLDRNQASLERPES